VVLTSPGVLSKWEGRGEVVYVSDRPCEASDVMGEGCKVCDRKSEVCTVFSWLYMRGEVYSCFIPTAYRVFIQNKSKLRKFSEGLNCGVRPRGHL
jgi:hypothetical protein